MSENLFGDLDIASAPDNPWEIPDGQYDAVVKSVKVGPTKKGDKIGLTIDFSLTDEEYVGNTTGRWMEVPQPADPQNPTVEERRMLSYIKKALIGCGVPENEVNSVQPDTVVGNEVSITVRNKNGYVNVTHIGPRTDDVQTSDFQ